MLKTKLPSDRSKQEFVVLDIENRADGSVLRVTTAWREGGSVSIRSDYGWANWWAWYHPRAAADPKFRTVWAHNGGSWDWLSLIQWLIREGHAEHSGVSIVAPSSKIVVAKVETPEVKITLADSCELLRASLSKLSAKFCGRGKVNLSGRMPWEVAESDAELFDRYCREDCLLLLEILENCLDFVRSKIAKIDKLSNTIGGTSLRVFRTLGLSHPIMSPWREDVRVMLRLGLHGGRCESFVRSKWLGKGIYVYDINSCYADVMRKTKVPATGRVIPVFNHTLKPGECGVYDVVFKQHNIDIPPILLQQQGRDKGHGTYGSTGVYMSPELHLLRELDPDAEIWIVSGFTFVDCGYIFRNFAEKVYAVRCEDRHGAGGEICKNLLVSLWGKFSQKGEMERLCAVNSVSQLIDMVRHGAKIRPLTHEGGLGMHDFADTHQHAPYHQSPVYSITETTDVHHEHVGISGVIASAARVACYRGIVAAGVDRVVYCDTDSVHVVGQLPPSMVDPEKLGAWKLVHGPCDGAYVNSQMYALKFDGGEKIVAKGISLDSRKLTYDTIRDMAESCRDFEIEYRNAATIHDVLAGQAPCVLRKRKKLVKAQKAVH